MNWHTEKRKISELRNWESNPRTITEKAYEELKKNVGDLGNFEPLVINLDNTVIAGNQRLRVLKEQGVDEVEVSVPDKELTEDEIKKIGVISNRHSGEWDMDVLANEFEETLQDLGFDDLLASSYSDVNEFETFGANDSHGGGARCLVQFVFDSKDLQKQVLSAMGTRSNTIDGVELAKLLNIEDV